MAGRRPNGLEESLQDFTEIEYKFVEDFDHEETFPDDDTKDLLENMGNYEHLEELEDYDS